MITSSQSARITYLHGFMLHTEARESVTPRPTFRACLRATAASPAFTLSSRAQQWVAGQPSC